MDKGYIENGFIVDLTNAKKVSGIIYELSRVLDMPEAKGKHICLKLGALDISQTELTSIKTLVELMEATLAFISTNSQVTLNSANELGIKISEFTNEIEAPDFNQEQNSEVTEALDNIFGEDKASEEEHIDEKYIPETIKDENNELPAESETADIEEENVEELIKEQENLPTLYLRKTIRSGQSISSDGNIVVIGDVNPGAEIIAKGDITVWGILGGIAHAGSEGNKYAKIRALKLNPVQIRIGEIFARRPDTVNLPYIQKSSEYTPEEAYTYKNSIVIRKLHNEN